MYYNKYYTITVLLVVSGGVRYFPCFAALISKSSGEKNQSLLLHMTTTVDN